MLLEEIVDTKSQSDNKPQIGDVIIITHKNGSIAGVLGEFNSEMGKVYDFKTRNVIGNVILKYLQKTNTKSKHQRKTLARHLGFKSDDSSPSQKFVYKDVSRIKKTGEDRRTA